MNDKMYQTVKWIAIGILIGYAGKYALVLFKAKRDQDGFSSHSRQKEIITRNSDYQDANEY